MIARDDLALFDEKGADPEQMRAWIRTVKRSFFCAQTTEGTSSAPADVTRQDSAEVADLTARLASAEESGQKVWTERNEVWKLLRESGVDLSCSGNQIAALMFVIGALRTAERERDEAREESETWKDRHHRACQDLEKAERWNAQLREGCDGRCALDECVCSGHEGSRSRRLRAALHEERSARESAEARVRVLEAALLWAMDQMQDEVSCGDDCAPYHGQMTCPGHVALGDLWARHTFPLAPVSPSEPKPESLPYVVPTPVPVTSCRCDPRAPHEAGCEVGHV